MQINMYNDILFKYFIRCEETRPVVAEFLSKVTGISKEDLMNADYLGGVEHKTEKNKEKVKISDIIVKVDDFNRIVIEMNQTYTPSIFNKNTSYAFSVVSSSMKKGKKYKKNKVLLVNIDKFNHFKTKRPILNFKLKDEENHIENEMYNSYHIIVDNFTKRNYNKIEKEIVKFIRFLNHTSIEEMKKDYEGDIDYMAGIVSLEDYMKDIDKYGLLYDYKEETESMMEEKIEYEVELAKEQKVKESAIEFHKNGVSDEVIMNSLHISKEQLEEYLNEEQSQN